MIAQRPTSLPLWATGAAAGRVVEPVEAKRVAGFNDSERPPGTWLNYAFNSLGGWVDFLRGPGLSNWERAEVPANLFTAAVDDVSSDAGVAVPSRRVVAVDDSNLPHVWATITGDEWTQLPVAIASGTLGAPRSIAFTGAHWLLATVAGSTGELWSTAASGGSVYDPTLPWSAVTLPGGTTEIDAVGAKRDPGTGAPLELVAVSQDKILFATSLAGALVFANATTVGATAGPFLDVLWSGTRWVAVNEHGEVWSSTTAGGTWTKTATLTTASPPYYRRLASDGAGTVLAYPLGASGVDAWWVSTDGGATFASQAGPPNLTKITRVRVLGKAWLLTSNATPFLATANAPSTNGWLGLPVPIVESGAPSYHLQEVAYAAGAVLALGAQFWLRSARAADVGPGGYAPGTASTALFDAAYLRGRYVEPTAPTDGQALVWSAADDAWEPGSAGSPSRQTWIGTVTGNGSNVRNNYLGQDWSSNTGLTAHGYPVGAGVAKNLRVHCPANGLATDTDVTFYVATGGASVPSLTTLTITVPSGTVGEYADTTHTVALAAGDRIACLVGSHAGGGAGTIELSVSVDIVS